jgi:hypothetical protein
MDESKFREAIEDIKNWFEFPDAALLDGRQDLVVEHINGLQGDPKWAFESDSLDLDKDGDLLSIKPETAETLRDAGVNIPPEWIENLDRVKIAIKRRQKMSAKEDAKKTAPAAVKTEAKPAPKAATPKPAAKPAAKANVPAAKVEDDAKKKAFAEKMKKAREDAKAKREGSAPASKTPDVKVPAKAKPAPKADETNSAEPLKLESEKVPEPKVKKEKSERAPGRSDERRSFMIPLIEKGISKEELFARMKKSFGATATDNALKVQINRSKDPKWNKLPKLVKEDADGILTFK